MKRIIILALCIVCMGHICAFNKHITPADSLPAYYASIDGTSGKQLLDAIQEVAKIGYRTFVFRYDSVWLAL